MGRKLICSQPVVMLFSAFIPFLYLSGGVQPAFSATLTNRATISEYEYAVDKGTWVRNALKERYAVIGQTFPTNPVSDSQQHELQQLKNSVKSIVPQFVDLDALGANGLAGWYFGNGTNGPTGLPMFSVTGLCARVGAPTNYFDYTPMSDLADYGWDYIKDAICLLSTVETSYEIITTSETWVSYYNGNCANCAYENPCAVWCSNIHYDYGIEEDSWPRVACNYLTHVVTTNNPSGSSAYAYDTHDWTFGSEHRKAACQASLVVALNSNYGAEVECALAFVASDGITWTYYDFFEDEWSYFQHGYDDFGDGHSAWYSTCFVANGTISNVNYSVMRDIHKYKTYTATSANLSTSIVAGIIYESGDCPTSSGSPVCKYREGFCYGFWEETPGYINPIANYATPDNGFIFK